MNNVKSGWTKTKWTKKSINAEQMALLKANHDVNVGSYGRIFIRKRNRQLKMSQRPMIQVNDQRRMLTRMKPVRLTNWKRITKWLRKLLVITITVLIATSVVYFDTDHYLSPLDGDKAVKLIPCHACKFTEQELEDFENKFKLQAVEAKREEKKQEKLQTTKTDIERLVLETFGADNYDTAMCIVKHESGANPTRENRGRARGGYSGECSIGLFQINLASNGCVGKRVHWNKVEGNTLEEKVEWLKVPENNVRVAKQIFDSSKWSPWSTYRKCR